VVEDEQDDRGRRRAEARRGGHVRPDARDDELLQPGGGSYAQQTHESTSEDIFRFYRKPPEGLSYRNKEERRRIHRYVYFGSPWVDLDDIEGTAAEIMQTDPSQAERFFGNRIVAGSGSWLQPAPRRTGSIVRDRPKSEPVCLGFDGSDVDDWTAIRAITFDQHLFTPLDATGRRTIWNPKESADGHVPRQDVIAAFDHLFRTYDVVRAYLDPPDWGTSCRTCRAGTGRRSSSGGRRTGSTRCTRRSSGSARRSSRPVKSLTIDGDQDAIRHLQHAIVRPTDGADVHPREAVAGPEDRRHDVGCPRVRGGPRRDRGRRPREAEGPAGLDDVLRIQLRDRFHDTVSHDTRRLHAWRNVSRASG
jgi:hypothetical protein